jgi:hypothetical protein
LTTLRVLTRTIPLTLTPTQRARLQGARTPGPAPLFDQRPTRVQRTVSCRGGTQIIGQRVQVGRRANRHHRSRRDHPARLRPTRTLDQAYSPHQPQGGHPTQGLRSHHQPKNRLGTVTHQLKTIRHPSCGGQTMRTRHWSQTCHRKRHSSQHRNAQTRSDDMCVVPPEPDIRHSGTRHAQARADLGRTRNQYADGARIPECKVMFSSSHRRLVEHVSREMLAQPERRPSNVKEQ